MSDNINVGGSNILDEILSLEHDTRHINWVEFEGDLACFAAHSKQLAVKLDIVSRHGDILATADEFIE